MKNLKKVFQHSIIRLINAYLPPLVWASFIFFLSAQSQLPGMPNAWMDLIFKQSAHTFVYAVLHFLVWRGVHQTTSSPAGSKSIFLPILITFLYALSDEFHQSFTPGRQPSLIDIGFDSMGIALSIILAHYLTHRQKRIHSDTLSNTKSN